MAKSKQKQLAKQRVARVWCNLERSAKELADVYVMFQPIHSKEAEKLEIIAKTVMWAQTMVATFWKANWGELPENWESWAR